MSLELSTWREACGAGNLATSLERLRPVIASQFPLAAILIRRLDRESRRLDTAALARAVEIPPPPRTRTEFEVKDLERLEAWCRDPRSRGQLASAGPDFLRKSVPLGVVDGSWVGPLASGTGGAAGVLVLVPPANRPFPPQVEQVIDELIPPLSAALEKGRWAAELSRLREAALANQRAGLLPQDIAESIVGAETGLRGVMERVELVARTDAPVLILGETGSGKEVVARAIHARSRRANGPVLRVNCGAIPSELVDSELFGHERGSFTGATATRKGWFERADGGTLFLDEIGELPLAAQVRLLRIIQDGTFERVGGQASLTVDVRLVAATHRDLPTMVRAMKFREDLWYRIGVFPILLPPLRDRREDIPALASHFSHRAGMRLGAAPLQPTAQDIDLLMSYHWPGNVRELAAVIERAAILGNGCCLKLAAALGPPERISATRDPEPAAAIPRAVSSLPASPAGPSGFPTLDQAMRHHIEAALERTRGRIEGPEGAARLLDINPHTLRGRMRNLGIEWGLFRG